MVICYPAFHSYQEFIVAHDVIVFSLVSIGFVAGRADGIFVIFVVGKILRRSIT